MKDISAEKNNGTIEALRLKLGKANKRIEALKVSEKQHKKSQKVLEEVAGALKERVKELNCLYTISSIVEREGITIDEVLQRTVDIIPDAWQYPEITCSRIVLGEREFRSAAFMVTRWKQSQILTVQGKEAGCLEVYYSEERPPGDEGPFLKEERSLINVIAGRMGTTIERKMGEAALIESESRNRALLDAIPDLMFEISEQGCLTAFHQGQFNISADWSRTIIGRNIYSIAEIERVLPKRILDQVMTYVRLALDTGRTQVFEQHVLLNGERKDVEVRMVVYSDRNVLVMVRDITTRKRLEGEILEISGREQRRIGQDLHDSLCQQLAGIGFMAKALQRKSSEGQVVDPSDVGEVVTLIDEAITLTRGFARGLNPVRLEADGLMMALSELVNTVERLFGISCFFECAGEILIDDNVAATHVYRIVQEALSNAIKHGRADRITVVLKAEGHNCVVSVRDNGCGIGKAVNHGKGLGLNIMQYRASVIGGTLELRNSESGGAVVTCSFQNKRAD